MFDIDKILNTQFGDPGGELAIEFKKTVKVKQYETEAISVSMRVNLQDASGPYRVMAYTLLEAQAEYAAMANLVTKGHITQQEFILRVQALESYVNSMAAKYKSITGLDAEKEFGSMFNGAPNGIGSANVQQMMTNTPVMQSTVQGAQKVNNFEQGYNRTVNQPVGQRPVQQPTQTTQQPNYPNQWQPR